MNKSRWVHDSHWACRLSSVRPMTKSRWVHKSQWVCYSSFARFLSSLPSFRVLHCLLCSFHVLQRLLLSVLVSYPSMFAFPLSSCQTHDDTCSIGGAITRKKGDNDEGPHRPGALKGPYRGEKTAQEELACSTQLQSLLRQLV